MNTNQRNERAKQYILDMLDVVADSKDEDFKSLPSFKQIEQTLTELVDIPQKGFRGVVATALTGIHLDPSYDPLNNFYGCNPRSIFEQGIFYALNERQIPCGKSDPLNVAKNQRELNYAWAEGRRPQNSARAAVDYLTYLEGLTNTERELAVKYYFFRLLQFGNSIASISTAKPPEADSVSSQDLANKLSDLIEACPESGTIPQKVIALLLKKLYVKSTVKVIGGDESVFGTNTTSKKPSDLWLEDDGKPFNLFEVTVKKVDKKRIDDALDSLITLGLSHLPVTFICRIPDDISSIDAADQTFYYRDKYFNFVDIDEFISVSISQLSVETIKELMAELTEFINLHDRPVSTKNAWNKIFNESGDLE